ncbi:MAG: tRNA (N6-isopentenyl adenosine(37)-C2)-methylthiotransferase MiaB [Hyphomicrobiaceae bacterium]
MSELSKEGAAGSAGTDPATAGPAGGAIGSAAEAPPARRPGTDNTRRVHIRTFGCQMNVYDSERMADAVGREGYVETDRPEDADLVILNTCHIREKAAEKVYSELGRLRRLKKERGAAGRETLIAVAGCVAQAEGEEIGRRAPVVDLVIGPQSYHRLPELLSRHRQTGRQIVETEFPGFEKFDALPARAPRRAPTAFLTIQEGCDKFCTFCVVPYTRGAEISRPLARILDEARNLVAGGVREITLLGQNVNAYHGAGEAGAEVSLADLIERLSEIEGLARLRYMTSHPRDMDEPLIAAHGRNGKLMPFLHLPVQSGSDRILKAMNRHHTADEYRALVARIRAARPDIVLSTDIIVGFPGETDEDFAATMALVREIGFPQAFSFKYSERPGTPAASAGAQVEESIKAERLGELNAELMAQRIACNRSMVGRTLEVLIERLDDRKGPGALSAPKGSGTKAPGSKVPGIVSPGRVALVGRTPYLQVVHLEGTPDMIGQLIEARISEATASSLRAVTEGA